MCTIHYSDFIKVLRGKYCLIDINRGKTLFDEICRKCDICKPCVDSIIIIVTTLLSTAVDVIICVGPQSNLCGGIRKAQ